MLVLDFTKMTDTKLIKMTKKLIEIANSDKANTSMLKKRSMKDLRKEYIEDVMYQTFRYPSMRKAKKKSRFSTENYNETKPKLELKFKKSGFLFNINDAKQKR